MYLCGVYTLLMITKVSFHFKNFICSIIQLGLYFWTFFIKCQVDEADLDCYI